jgi:hypothetical protein
MQRPHPRCLVGAAAGLVVGIAFAAMGFPARLRATPGRPLRRRLSADGLAFASARAKAAARNCPASSAVRGVWRRVRRCGRSTPSFNLLQYATLSRSAQKQTTQPVCRSVTLRIVTIHERNSAIRKKRDAASKYALCCHNMPREKNAWQSMAHPV